MSHASLLLMGPCSDLAALLDEDPLEDAAWFYCDRCEDERWSSQAPRCCGERMVLTP